MTEKIALLLTVVCFFSIAGCKQPAEELPAEMPPVVRADSWIGVELAEVEPRSEVIGSSATEVLVAGTIPYMPADGVLKEEDVILRLGDEPAAGAARTVEAIRRWPAGRALPLTVRRGGKEVVCEVIPIAKPAPSDLLGRVYVGRPMPVFSGYQISVARTDGKGGVVAGTQCVMKDDADCLGLGRLGRTNLARGKATAVLFWTRYDDLEGQPSTTKETLAVLKAWTDKYAGQGLEIVAVTRDTPRSIMPYLQKAGSQPPMTLMSVSLGRLGAARLAQTLAPSVLVLDEKGVVRGAAGAVGDLKSLGDRLLPQLLDAPR